MKQFYTLLLLLVTFYLGATPPTDFAPPTTAPTNFKAISYDGDAISLNWTNGNGTARIVIARKDAPVTFVPSKGFSYNASVMFGAGNEVAPGEFVVFNSTNSNVLVYNLQPKTIYHFAVFEYSGTGGATEYLTTPAIVSTSTVSPPTGQPSNLSVSNIIGNSLKLNWTNPTGANAGTGRIVIGREGAPVNVNPQDIINYVAYPQFGLGSEIGNGNFVLAKTNSNFLTVEHLKPGTPYHFALFEYKGNSGLVYNIINAPTISVTTLPRPTINASAPSFSFVEGNMMKIQFVRGNGARRLVVAKAGSPVTAVPVDGTPYKDHYVFGSAESQIAPGEYVVANGFIDNATVTGLTKGTTYHFAVYEYDGTGTGSAYLTAAPLTASQATVSAPTVHASNIQVSNLLNNTVTLSWTNGNGKNRLVLMRKGGPVNATPADLTNYGFSAYFGTGSQIGSGNYVVYSGTGNSVTVQSLAAGSTYHFAIYEYNGNGGPVYLTSNAPTGQFTTSQSPSQISSGFQITYRDGNRFTLNWTRGNGDQRIVVLKAGSAVTGTPVDGTTYTAHSNFGSGDQLGAGEYIVSNSSSTQLTILNLMPGTTYHIAVFEYNLVNGVSYYLATPATLTASTVSAPTINSMAMQFSNITGNSMKLTWTRGNGGSRIVMVKAGSAVDAAPANLTYYPDNSLLGYGAQIGNGNYVVYNGSGNTATLYGLQPGVHYHFAVYENNGISYPAYLLNGALTATQKTAERPSVPSSGIHFGSVEGNRALIKWTNGNGTKRILVGRAGSPVTGLPVDGVDYKADFKFGSGDQLGSGEFVLTNSNQSEFTITNLQPSTTYHFAVFEYDGAGAGTRYLTSGVASATMTTVSPPAGGPSNILFSSIGTTTASINWSTAVADRHLVVMRKGAPVTALPQPLTPYLASTNFGHYSTTITPENYAVFNSSGNNVNVASLQPGTTYYVSIFAFNGSLGPMYNTTQVASASFTTLGPPTDPAQEIAVVSAGNGHAVHLRWKNGSGQRRLVLMKAGGPVNALPVNNISYTANNFFGSGQQLGAGNFAVYNGTADLVTVNNLQKDMVYHIAVFEFNQFITGPVYLTSQFATAQFSGVILPVKLQSFTGVAAASVNQLQWVTTQEVASSSFVVERSTDGRTFEAIGSVPARGNSNAEVTYRYEDRNRLAVGYYRLRIVNVDGKIEYSGVIRLQATMAEGLRLFPTVASSSVQLNIRMTESTNGTIRIVDMNGRLLLQQNSRWEPGVVTTTLDVSSLAKGTYVVQVHAGKRLMKERFIKQ